MRVLVVRLGSMGDVLHALPAVAALRQALPDVYIGWAIERRWTPFLVADDKKDAGCPTLSPGVGEGWGSRSQQPLVDRVHIVDTLGWRKAPFSDATWADVLDTFRAIRALRYDLAIDFQGSVKSAFVAQLSGATARIGFAAPREKPATMFYTHIVQPASRHIIDQNLELLHTLVAPPFRPVLAEGGGVLSDKRQSTIGNVFPVDLAAASAIEQKFRPTLRARQTESCFAILNPGAGWPAKQWPASRYGEVARALRDDGVFCLVNHGPGEEAIAREVEAAGEGNARAIRCTLSELITLTRHASLFIGGDTGPMHLGALLGIPVVALFGPTDPARNGPYSRNSIVLRHSSSRTETTHASDPDRGLLQISAADVVNAARTLLARSPKSEARSQHA